MADTVVTASAPNGRREFQLVVSLPLLGLEHSNVTEWSITSHYLTSCDAFEFTLFDQPLVNTQRWECQPIELFLNNASQLIGRVDVTERGAHGTAMIVRGRDYIADMVECNIDPGFKVSIKDKLINVIRKAASPVGITTIIAQDEDDDDFLMQTVRSGKKPQKGHGSGHGRKRKRRRHSGGGKPLEDFKPEPGEGIYSFLNKIVARDGATIQPGAGRNELFIEEPNYLQEPLYRIARSTDGTVGKSNNIQSAIATRDFSRFPTYTMLHGQQAHGGGKSANTTSAIDMFAVAGSFRSELLEILQLTTVSGRWKAGEQADQVRDGALYRLFVHRDEVAKNADQVEMAAKRAIAERLKDTLEYKCTLRGHVDPESEAIYSVNTIIKVDDDICDVHEALWIAERTLRFSATDGATTELTCWRPESFELSG